MLNGQNKMLNGQNVTVDKWLKCGKIDGAQEFYFFIKNTINIRSKINFKNKI